MSYREYKYKKASSTLIVTMLVLIGWLVMFIVMGLVPQPVPAKARVYIPDPSDIEEFNRQECRLELDTDNTVHVYCKGA